MNHQSPVRPSSASGHQRSSSSSVSLAASPRSAGAEYRDPSLLFGMAAMSSHFHSPPADRNTSEWQQYWNEPRLKERPQAYTENNIRKKLAWLLASGFDGHATLQATVHEANLTIGLALCESYPNVPLFHYARNNITQMRSLLSSRSEDDKSFQIRFFAFKTPMDPKRWESYIPKQYCSESMPEAIIAKIRQKCGPDARLDVVIPLTKTPKYYNPVLEWGCAAVNTPVFNIPMKVRADFPKETATNRVVFDWLGDSSAERYKNRYLHSKRLLMLEFAAIGIDEAVIRALKDKNRDARANPISIGVHCTHGVNRTAAVIVYWLLTRGGKINSDPSLFEQFHQKRWKVSLPEDANIETINNNYWLINAWQMNGINIEAFRMHLQTFQSQKPIEPEYKLAMTQLAKYIREAWRQWNQAQHINLASAALAAVPSRAAASSSSGSALPRARAMAPVLAEINPSKPHSAVTEPAAAAHPMEIDAKMDKSIVHPQLCAEESKSVPEEPIDSASIENGAESEYSASSDQAESDSPAVDDTDPLASLLALTAFPGIVRMLKHKSIPSISAELAKQLRGLKKLMDESRVTEFMPAAIDHKESVQSNYDRLRSSPDEVEVPFVGPSGLGKSSLDDYLARDSLSQEAAIMQALDEAMRRMQIETETKDNSLAEYDPERRYIYGIFERMHIRFHIRDRSPACRSAANRAQSFSAELDINNHSQEPAEEETSSNQAVASSISPLLWSPVEPAFVQTYLLEDKVGQRNDFSDRSESPAASHSDPLSLLLSETAEPVRPPPFINPARKSGESTTAVETRFRHWVADRAEDFPLELTISVIDEAEAAEAINYLQRLIDGEAMTQDVNLLLYQRGLSLLGRKLQEPLAEFLAYAHSVEAPLRLNPFFRNMLGKDLIFSPLRLWLERHHGKTNPNELREFVSRSILEVQTQLLAGKHCGFFKSASLQLPLPCLRQGGTIVDNGGTRYLDVLKTASVRKMLQRSTGFVLFFNSSGSLEQGDTNLLKFVFQRWMDDIAASVNRRLQHAQIVLDGDSEAERPTEEELIQAELNMKHQVFCTSIAGRGIKSPDEIAAFLHNLSDNLERVLDAARDALLQANGPNAHQPGSQYARRIDLIRRKLLPEKTFQHQERFSWINGQFRFQWLYPWSAKKSFLPPEVSCVAQLTQWIEQIAAKHASDKLASLLPEVQTTLKSIHLGLEMVQLLSDIERPHSDSSEEARKWHEIQSHIRRWWPAGRLKSQLNEQMLKVTTFLHSKLKQWTHHRKSRRTESQLLKDDKPALTMNHVFGAAKPEDIANWAAFQAALVNKEEKANSTPNRSRAVRRASTGQLDSDVTAAEIRQKLRAALLEDAGPLLMELLATQERVESLLAPERLSQVAHKIVEPLENPSVSEREIKDDESELHGDTSEEEPDQSSKFQSDCKNLAKQLYRNLVREFEGVVRRELTLKIGAFSGAAESEGVRFSSNPKEFLALHIDQYIEQLEGDVRERLRSLPEPRLGLRPSAENILALLNQSPVANSFADVKNQLKSDAIKEMEATGEQLIDGLGGLQLADLGATQFNMLISGDWSQRKINKGACKKIQNAVAKINQFLQNGEIAASPSEPAASPPANRRPLTRSQHEQQYQAKAKKQLCYGQSGTSQRSSPWEFESMQLCCEYLKQQWSGSDEKADQLAHLLTNIHRNKRSLEQTVLLGALRKYLSDNGVRSSIHQIGTNLGPVFEVFNQRFSGRSTSSALNRFFHWFETPTNREWYFGSSVILPEHQTKLFGDIRRRIMEFAMMLVMSKHYDPLRAAAKANKQQLCIKFIEHEKAAILQETWNLMHNEAGKLTWDKLLYKCTVINRRAVTLAQHVALSTKSKQAMINALLTQNRLGGEHELPPLTNEDLEQQWIANQQADQEYFDNSSGKKRKQTNQKNSKQSAKRRRKASQAVEEWAENSDTEEEDQEAVENESAADSFEAGKHSDSDAESDIEELADIL